MPWTVAMDGRKYRNVLESLWRSLGRTKTHDRRVHCNNVRISPQISMYKFPSFEVSSTATSLSISASTNSLLPVAYVSALQLYFRRLLVLPASLFLVVTMRTIVVILVEGAIGWREAYTLWPSIVQGQFGCRRVPMPSNVSHVDTSQPQFFLLLRCGTDLVPSDWQFCQSETRSQSASHCERSQVNGCLIILLLRDSCTLTSLF